MKVKALMMMNVLAVLALLLSSPGAVPLGANQASAMSSPDAEPARIAATSLSSPVMFIQNVGQFDKRALFQVRGSDKTIWLAEDGIWVTVLGPRSGDAEEPRRDSLLHPHIPAS